MKAMIFAAGLGTRLRPLTDSMPKALVPVGGVPMLQRVMEKLKAAGIGEFVVNVHHFAAQIEEFLLENRNFGVHVDISRETERPLETGGGIRKAEPFLRGGRFLVHNVDMLSDLDLRSFMAADSPSSLATLLVTDSADADRYLLFDDGLRLTGWTNVRTGEVRSPYPDFDPSRFRRLSFCGIHVVSPEVFPLMRDWPDRFSIIDFYLSVAASHEIRAVYVPDLHIIDIGSPGNLAEAGRRLAAGDFL